ncbi:MAG: hypothetical protein U0166_00765 [Acidobacteriota bacterium]
MQSRDVFIALTCSESGETLYAATPLGGDRYRIRSCLLPACESADPVQRERVGALLCVRPAKVGLDRDRMVRCGSTVFERVGAADRLAVGTRVAAGGDGNSVQVVSSPIRELHVVDVDRCWIIEPLLRAYRNQDAGWRELLTEDPSVEHGNEGIVDDDSASISADAIEGFYRRRLARKAGRRLESARKRGLEVDPRHVLVCNDDFRVALSQVSGEIEGAPSLHGKERDATAGGVDAMLATILAADLPHPARVVVVRQRDLEASLLDAAGPGMKVVELRGPVRDRRTGGRIAEGLDRMLRTVKGWTDAPAALAAAA